MGSKREKAWSGLPEGPGGVEGAEKALDVLDAPEAVLERPRRDAALHSSCGHIVLLAGDVADAFWRSPGLLSSVRCPHCRASRPVGEFTWHEGGGSLSEP